MKVSVLSAVLVLVAASAILIGQGERPGQIWPAKVWIQNHDPSEAVPVSIQDTPWVQVTGTPSVTITPTTIVQSRLVRQTWEYNVVTVPTGRDPIPALSRAGQDGWEAAGVQLSGSEGTSIVMKRPRP
jgi:hypothetical protein